MSVAKITASFPESVKKFAWVRNHHFLELEDIKGNRSKLDASGILIGACDDCKEKCAAFSNQGKMACTHCGGAVKWQWTQPQLCFVPEKETDFLPFPVSGNPPNEK